MALNMLRLLVIALLKNANLFLHVISKGCRVRCCRAVITQNSAREREQTAICRADTGERASTWLPAGCVLKPNIYISGFQGPHLRYE